MNYVNINGRLVPANDASVALDNGAFRYGYGLFETMLVRDNAIRLNEYHWERLFGGLSQLHFDIPSLLTPAYLEDQVMQLVHKNDAAPLCRIRLQLFAPGGGLFSHHKWQPSFVIECFSLNPSDLDLNENGLVLGLATGLQKSTDALANLKSCNALIYAIAARQARENQWNDALILNTAGNIIESTIANIFWITDDIIYTPPLADGCIAGVMRRHLLSNNSIVERSLTLPTLLEADEVFLTNAIKQVRWVGMMDKRKYGNSRAKELFKLAGA